MTFEQQLANVDKMIASFQRIVESYPDNESYKESLAQLQEQRARLVDTIGRKNGN